MWRSLLPNEGSTAKLSRIRAWEMALMRMAFAVMVWQSVPSFFYSTTLPHPNGLAHFVDLSFLMNSEILGMLRGVLAVALVFYVAGFFVFVSLGFMTFLLVGLRVVGKLPGCHQSLPFSHLALAALAQWLVAGFFVIRDRVARKAAFFPLAVPKRNGCSATAPKLPLFRVT